MEIVRLNVVVAAAVLLLSTGCTHRQLRYDHVMQAKSITTIYEQQVLDNLAMFSQNIDSVPFLAIPSGGTSQVVDNGGVGASTLNGPARTVIGPLSVGRNNTESWTLLPVSDPAKLRIMKDLYVAAVSGGICLRASNPRNPASECSLRGSYCGCSVEVCPESKAAFSELVINILEAKEDPPSPAAAPTVEIVDVKYDSKDRISQLRTYSREIELKPAGTDDISSSEKMFSLRSTADGANSMDQVLGKIVSPSIPSTGAETFRRSLRRLQSEEQRSRFRATLFPE